jgi:hypothetical protein
MPQQRRVRDLPGASPRRMVVIMDRSPLDDPATAAHAWARFRRMFKAWSLFTLGVVAAVLGWLAMSQGFESVHIYLAMALGVGVTMELAGALMGLAFLSSGTGHDEAVGEFIPEDQDSAG